MQSNLSPPSSTPREPKPWPMRWVVLVIVVFIAFYSVIRVVYQKEEDPHEPFHEAQIRGGHELREAGWEPLPNAYGLPGSATDMADSTGHASGSRQTAIDFEQIDRSDPRVAEWTDLLPPLEQGEQLQRIDAPLSVAVAKPYTARLVWDAPDDFRSPQLLIFRRDRQILIVPRAPERFVPDEAGSTVLIIPPETLSAGEYEVFLSTESLVNRWTFRAE